MPGEEKRSGVNRESAMVSGNSHAARAWTPRPQRLAGLRAILLLADTALSYRRSEGLLAISSATQQISNVLVLAIVGWWLEWHALNI
jgi:hypothetical protein